MDIKRDKQRPGLFSRSALFLAQSAPGEGLEYLPVSLAPDDTSIAHNIGSLCSLFYVTVNFYKRGSMNLP